MKMRALLSAVGLVGLSWAGLGTPATASAALTPIYLNTFDDTGNVNTYWEGTEAAGFFTSPGATYTVTELPFGSPYVNDVGASASGNFAHIVTDENQEANAIGRGQIWGANNAFNALTAGTYTINLSLDVSGDANTMFLFQLESSAQGGDYRPFGTNFGVLSESTSSTAANTFHHISASFNLTIVDSGPLDITNGVIKAGTFNQTQINFSIDRRFFHPSYSGQTNIDNIQFSIVELPEPTSAGMLLGMGALVGGRRRMKR